MAPQILARPWLHRGTGAPTHDLRLGRSLGLILMINIELIQCMNITISLYIYIIEVYGLCVFVGSLCTCAYVYNYIYI